MTLREFSTAYYDKRYLGSKVPAHAQPRKPFSDKKANDLTKSIIAFFEMHDVKAWRQASEGRFIRGKEYVDWKGIPREEKGTFIPRSKAAKGIGDVASVVKGLFISWEIKIKKDYQKPDQKEFQSDLEKSGGKYHIVKDWDSFYSQVKQYL